LACVEVGLGIQSLCRGGGYGFRAQQLHPLLSSNYLSARHFEKKGF
jgi:hypothetical protein